VALPLLLAGPIVRRVEANLVAVWVALSEPATVRLSIWEGAHDAHATEPGAVTGNISPLHSEETPTLRIAARFHAALPTIDLGAEADEEAAEEEEGDEEEVIGAATSLRPGQIYSYDIVITPAGGSPTGLRAQGLLNDGPLPDVADRTDRPDNAAIGYQGGRLPSFVTCPTKLEDLVLMQASCRKAARAGDDAMLYLDRLIETDPLARPHQLFLTGDQIYGDDVPGSMLQLAINLGHELVGGFEMVPLGPGRTVEGNGTNLPPLLRQRLCTESAKLTSKEAQSHLITLGEYLAMYLLYLSPAVWDRLPIEDAVFSGVASAVPDLLGTEKRDDTWVRADIQLAEAVAAIPGTSGADRDEKEEKLRRIRRRPIEFLMRGNKTRGLDPKLADEEFRDQVARARRLLANVATYMIFDDHDVTDDWNLRKKSHDEVLASALGNTLVRNALVAYAVCQAWGNDPRAWKKGKNRALLTAAGELFPGDGVAPRVPDPFADEDIGQLLGNMGGTPEVAWNFQWDGPAHRVVVLDTRTRREFASRLGPPALLSSEQLGSQLPSGPLQPPQELLVLVSAAPVAGPPVIDHIGQPLGAVLIRPDAVEHESWAQSDEAFEGLLARLATYPRVLILSGDVHFAASMTLDYFRKQGSKYATSRFVQLTSSPVRHSWPPAVGLLFRDLVSAQSIIGQAAPAERLGWKNNAPAVLANVEKALIKRQARLRGEPVLVPVEGWPEEAAEAREPDFAWRLSFVDDVRAETDRPEQARLPAIGSVDDTDPLPGYRSVVATHQAAIEETAQVRRLIFLHNASRILFERDDEGLRVRHELWSRNDRHPAAVRPDVNTLHVVRLDPDDAEAAADSRPRIGAPPE
jgi:hypothetical protein